LPVWHVGSRDFSSQALLADAVTPRPPSHESNLDAKLICWL
jgi:hypothetical protein